MNKTLSFIAGAFMFLTARTAGAQALPFTVIDSDPVTLAKGGAGLAETGSVSHAAFANSAAIPFSESVLDVSAGYMMWQPTSVKSNIISVGTAYNMKNKLGIAVGFHYGMNPAYDITDDSGTVGGTFRPGDLHAAVGVSYRFLKFMSAGINFGYASSSLAEGHSYGAVAADVFLMAKFSSIKVTAGASNILGSVMSASGEKFSLPSSIALGVGNSSTIGEKHLIEANLDMDYFLTGGFSAAVGASYTFNDMVTARLGGRVGGKSPIPSYSSVGLGCKFAGVKLDLAYLIAGSDSPMKNTLALSLGYSF